MSFSYEKVGRRWKYKLTSSYYLYLPLLPGIDTTTTDGYVSLRHDGVLCLKEGYHWDGASSIAIDTKSFMRGSLVHDALYQLMREDILSWDFKDVVDKILIDLCKEDGMGWLRRKYIYFAVSKFGPRGPK